VKSLKDLERAKWRLVAQVASQSSNACPKLSVQWVPLNADGPGNGGVTALIAFSNTLAKRTCEPMALPRSQRSLQLCRGFLFLCTIPGTPYLVASILWYPKVAIRAAETLLACALLIKMLL